MQMPCCGEEESGATDVWNGISAKERLLSTALSRGDGGASGGGGGVVRVVPRADDRI